MDTAGGTRAVAEAMGVTPQTVRQWATGNKPIPPVRVNQLKKLARNAEAGAGGDQTAAEATTSERPRGLRGDGATIPVVNVPSKASTSAGGGLWPFNVGAKGKSGASSAAPLTKGEAEALREGVVKFLAAMGEYTDEGIGFTNAKRATPAIWSAMDDEELGILADFLISRGLRSGVAAATVRNMARTWELFKVGAILLPRFKATVAWYRDNGGFAL